MPLARALLEGCRWGHPRCFPPLPVLLPPSPRGRGSCTPNPWGSKGGNSSRPAPRAPGGWGQNAGPGLAPAGSRSSHSPVWDPSWIPGPVLGPFIPCTAPLLGRGSPGNPTLKPDPSAGEPPGPGSGCRALSSTLSSVLGGRASPPASPLTAPLSPSLHAVPAVGQRADPQRGQRGGHRRAGDGRQGQEPAAGPREKPKPEGGCQERGGGRGGLQAGEDGSGVLTGRGPVGGGLLGLL